MRIAVGSASVVLAAVGMSIGAWQPAGAADLPARPTYKEPAIVVSGPNWTGFYINAGGGYGLWTADTTTAFTPGAPTPPMVINSRQGGSGWLGRVGVGFDYQFTSRIVAGVFGDFDYSSIEGTIVDPAPAIAGQIKQTRSWAVGARGGLLATPAILSYWNAGYTNARFSSASMRDAGGGFIAPPGALTGDTTPAFSAGGWFLGGGTDIALTSFGNGWFWRNEYRYAYYGNQVLKDTGSNIFLPINNSINFKPTVQTVTTQLVYKFNPGLASASFDVAAAPAMPSHWSGVYVGGGIGYGMWAADTSATTTPIKQTQGGKGWLGRVSGGFDYQFGSFVAGLVADFDGSSLEGTIQDAGGAVSGTIKQKWSWSAGGRAGLLVSPAILSYVSGGYTAAHFSPTTLVFTIPPAAAGSPSGFGTAEFDSSGWFLGGGVEFAMNFFGNGWFWRNDYRFAQYDSKTLPEKNAATGAIPSNITFKPQVQTVTTSLIYKFNWGG